MADAPERDEGLPPSLRLLKALVIVLTLTMIGGVITVVALIVTRMPTALQAPPRLPGDLELPEGMTAHSVTFGTDWYAVITTSDQLLLYTRDGRLRQQLDLDLPRASEP